MDRNLTRRRYWFFLPVAIAALALTLLHPSRFLKVGVEWVNGQINGGLRLDSLNYSWLQPGTVTLQGLKLDDEKQQNLLSVQRLVIDVSLWSLLVSETHVRRITLQDAEFNSSVEAVQRALGAGHSKLQPQKNNGGNGEEGAQRSLRVDAIDVSGNLNISDVSNGFTARGASLGASDIRLTLRQPARAKGDVRFSAESLAIDNTALGPVSAEMAIANQQSEVRIHQLAGVTGALSAQISSGNGFWQLTQIDLGLNLADMANRFFPQTNVVSGKGALKGSIGGNTTPLFLDSIDGDLALSVEGLEIDGVDLNALLNGLEQANETTFLDIGGVMLTGPLGLIGSQLAKMGTAGIDSLNGHTSIPQALVDVAIQGGVLTTRDVALATQSHRVSFDGQVNLNTTAFIDMDFYLLDKDGCALADQQLNGAITAPEGTKTALLETKIIKPFTNIIDEFAGLLEACEVVYRGAIPHPL